LRVVGSKIYSRLVLSNPYVDQFKSNVDDKKSYIACKTTPEIEDIVTKSMAALGVNIARFDVFITNEGLKICEANSIGSIMSGEQTWNKKIRDDIVNFCINEYEKR
jgi:glutathione synthase/RimK-type ligase-like ATP-grasp enzyme